MQMVSLVTTAKHVRGGGHNNSRQPSKKTLRGGTIANSFYDVSSTLLLIPDKENLISLNEHTCKNPKQSISNSQPVTNINKYMPCPGMQFLNKSTKIHSINLLKRKRPIISIAAERAI